MIFLNNVSNTLWIHFESTLDDYYQNNWKSISIKNYKIQSKVYQYNIISIGNIIYQLWTYRLILIIFNRKHFWINSKIAPVNLFTPRSNRTKNCFNDDDCMMVIILSFTIKKKCNRCVNIIKVNQFCPLKCLQVCFVWFFFFKKNETWISIHSKIINT